MRRILALTALLLLAGCSEESKDQGPPPIQLPPAYGRGDEVAVRESEVIGVVIDVNSDTPTWNYTVMFKDRNINYSEKDLRLIERFDWSRRPAKKVQAEIDVLH